VLGKVCQHVLDVHCEARRYGYQGFYNKQEKPVVLTRKNVDGIQLTGGTILGTSRGGADIKCAPACEACDVRRDAPPEVVPERSVRHRSRTVLQIAAFVGCSPLFAKHEAG